MNKTKAQIQKEFNEFAEKIAKLESLKHELDALDTKGFESEARLIRAKLKDIGEIPSITRNISELKKKIEKKHAGGGDAGAALKRRISHLEGLIAEKKRPRAKQLTGKEVEEVKDIPKLEGELHKLRKLFEEHMSQKKVKVDTGVGLIVDSKFDDFISQIKADLTEKLREEEKLLRDGESLRLRADLEKRKEVFAEKAAELENKKKEEAMLLKAGLERKKKLLSEKAYELDSEKKEESVLLKSKLTELENKKKEDAMLLKSKMAELENKKKGEDILLKAELAKRKKEFASKYANLVKQAHSDYKKKVEDELKKEVGRRFNSELKNKLSEMKAEVIKDTKKKVLISLMNENKKKLDLSTRKTAQKLGSETKNVISRLKDKMHNEMIAKVKSEVRKKEHGLRKELERDYKEKLAIESKIKQAELEKRKAQMEKFVEAQAKRIFK